MEKQPGECAWASESLPENTLSREEGSSCSEGAYPASSSKDDVLRRISVITLSSQRSSGSSRALKLKAVSRAASTRPELGMCGKSSAGLSRSGGDVHSKKKPPLLVQVESSSKSEA